MGKKANVEAINLARDFKEKAKDKYAIEKIILFGSQATGMTREGSDIDLLVVSEKFRNRDKAASMSQLLEEWHLVQKKTVPVDFICLTPEEFDEMSKQITIVRQALKEGVAI